MDMSIASKKDNCPTSLRQKHMDELKHIVSKIFLFLKCLDKFFFPHNSLKLCHLEHNKLHASQRHIFSLKGLKLVLG